MSVEQAVTLSFSSFPPSRPIPPRLSYLASKDPQAARLCADGGRVLSGRRASEGARCHQRGAQAVELRLKVSRSSSSSRPRRLFFWFVVD